MKTMTEKLKTLNSLLREGCVDPNDFYSITVCRSDVRLQGYASRKRRLKYKSMFSLKKSDYAIGQFEGNRGDVRMVLTRKD